MSPVKLGSAAIKGAQSDSELLGSMPLPLAVLNSIRERPDFIPLRRRGPDSETPSAPLRLEQERADAHAPSHVLNSISADSAVNDSHGVGAAGGHQGTRGETAWPLSWGGNTETLCRSRHAGNEKEGRLDTALRGTLVTVRRSIVRRRPVGKRPPRSR
ncbi:hypothetical protein AAFF_G00074160 [Aldrovandia affinis]|uniref:Uncharacterized protein n=1 Tax=Aldrovandia affinis TaxID=143900 RepID=A0AAD7RYI3_9TELE|nr:hypothetical protein AAFF_G00074160 [Aldrovandia affinis]